MRIHCHPVYRSSIVVTERHVYDILHIYIIGTYL